MIPFERKIEDLEQQKVNKKIVNKSLNTSGWYRVAKLGSMIGTGRAFLFSVTTYYNNTPNCSNLLSINCIHNKAKIIELNHLALEDAVSKVRIVKASEDTGYLEIFYKFSQFNSVLCEIVSDYDKITMLDFENAEDNVTVLDEITLVNEVESLNVSGLLINSWKVHQGNQIFKKQGIVHVSLTVKEGTNVNVFVLPERI